MNEGLMNILVIGDWHLAHITSGALIKIGHKVTLLTNRNVRDDIKKNQLVISEPDLDKVFQQGFKDGFLFLENQLSNIINIFDFVWIANDTSLEKRSEEIMLDIYNLISDIRNNLSFDIDIVISSQIPLGTTNFLKKKFLDISCKLFIVPENLQLGNGINSFLKQERFILGFDNNININQKSIYILLKQITNNIICMNHNSAELLKHSLNSYLAMNITFANEIGKIAKIYNASSYDISKGLRSDKRVGQNAYLLAGNAFHGGTLKRDLNHLSNLAAKEKVEAPLINSILVSNKIHSNFVLELLNSYSFIKNIFIFGLSYKINSNVLRDSNYIKDVYKLSKTNKKIFCLDTDIRINDPKIIDLKNKNVEIFDSYDDLPKELIFDCFIINKIKKIDVEKTIKFLRESFKEGSKILVIDLNKILFSSLNSLDLEYLNYETL